MATKTQASVHTAQTLMRELLDAAREFEKLFSRLARTDPESGKYFDLLGDIWASAELIETKAGSCKEVADELMGAFPDDD